jgi:hypothetical protein
MLAIRPNILGLEGITKSGNEGPVIIKLGTRWRRMISFMYRADLPPVPFQYKPGRDPRTTGGFGREGNHFPCHKSK